MSKSVIDYSLPVTWRDGERHCVGKAVTTKPKAQLGDDYVYATLCDKDGTHRGILIAHAHTGELEFVAESSLSQYPSEEIQTP